MRKLVYILAIIGFLFINAEAQNSRTVTVKSERYDSYFEKNNAGLKGDVSYVVLNNQSDFDKVFGSAATMGENSFLPEKAFDSMFVVATIKRGAMLRKYEAVETTAENGNLYVRYNAADAKSDSAMFASPLILGVPKGKYKKIVFVENGKEVKSMNFKK